MTQAHGLLHQVLNPALLKEVCQFWFRHIDDDDHLIVPEVKEALVWFSQDDSFDRECIAKFGSAIEVIHSSNATARDIVDAAQVESPLEWVSLIILLDQLPRNCNRGRKAQVAYRFFDPLALEVAMQAITARIPEKPEVRYRHAYRLWFYLPLEHSESLGVLNIVLQEHDKMFRDSRDLMGKSLESKNDMTVQCRTGLIRREHAFELWEKALREIVGEHVETIQLYGRYPHRDLALGR